MTVSRIRRNHLDKAGGKATAWTKLRKILTCVRNRKSSVVGIPCVARDPFETTLKMYQDQIMPVVFDQVKSVYFILSKM
jgi:hypothetical protein